MTVKPGIPTGVLALSAALVPLLAVTAGRLIGSGPRAANASVELVEPVTALSRVQPTPLLPEQEQLLELAFAGRVDARGMGEPFYRHVEREPITIVTEVEEPRAPEERRPVPAFTQRLTSVMGGSRPTAVLGGHMRVIGQIVEPDWMLVALDPDARTATIKHRSGAEVVLSIGVEIND